jgi:tight adherence protein B
MRLALRVALAAAAATVWVGAAAGASSMHIVPGGAVTYPDRAYILTLPRPKLLQRSQVSVTENGGPVSNLSLVRQGSPGGSSEVVLAIDASASMKGRPYADALAAARVFARHMDTEQRVAIVTFNDKVDVLQDFTTDKKKILDALGQNPELAYGTKIYDGLDKSLGMFDPTTPAAAIVLLSDGQDVGSSVPPGKVLAELRPSHVRVFSVGLVSRSFNAAALQQLASASHGSYIAASDPGQLAPIYDALGRQLSSEYLVRYRSRVNPRTHVVVRLSVQGTPGVATSRYTTPGLHIAPVGAYQPSTWDRIVQSGWTMLVVALILAALVGWAVSNATKGQKDALVHRVSGFVSIQRPEQSDRPKTKDSRLAGSLITRLRRRRSDSRPRWVDRLGSTLELADIEVEPIQVVALTILGTVLMMIILGAILGVVGVVIGLAMPLFVRAWIHRRISRKRAAFAEQLADNLEVLASALRAGHSLVSALAVVADDAIEPAKSEFRRVLAEEQFGVQLEDAFQVVVQRMENQDLDQVALVARLQREVGSNSAEVLDRVVETVRGRMELRRLVRTLTAQGRLSRWVLTALPIGLALVLTIVGRSYMQPLLHTSTGQLMLVVVGMMIALGSYIIKRIVDIKV